MASEYKWVVGHDGIAPLRGKEGAKRSKNPIGFDKSAPIPFDDVEFDNGEIRYKKGGKEMRFPKRRRRRRRNPEGLDFSELSPVALKGLRDIASTEAEPEEEYVDELLTKPKRWLKKRARQLSVPRAKKLSKLKLAEAIAAIEGSGLSKKDLEWQGSGLNERIKDAEGRVRLLKKQRETEKKMAARRLQEKKNKILDMKVKELKSELDYLQLPTSGDKKMLQDRLLVAEGLKKPPRSPRVKETRTSLVAQARALNKKLREKGKKPISRIDCKSNAQLKKLISAAKKKKPTIRRKSSKKKKSEKYSIDGRRWKKISRASRNRDSSALMEVCEEEAERAKSRKRKPRRVSMARRRRNPGRSRASFEKGRVYSGSVKRRGRGGRPLKGARDREISMKFKKNPFRKYGSSWSYKKKPVRRRRRRRRSRRRNPVGLAGGWQSVKDSFSVPMDMIVGAAGAVAGLQLVDMGIKFGASYIGKGWAVKITTGAIGSVVQALAGVGAASLAEKKGLIGRQSADIVRIAALAFAAKSLLDPIASSVLGIGHWSDALGLLDPSKMYNFELGQDPWRSVNLGEMAYDPMSGLGQMPAGVNPDMAYVPSINELGGLGQHEMNMDEAYAPGLGALVVGSDNTGSLNQDVAYTTLKGFGHPTHMLGGSSHPNFL